MDKMEQEGEQDESWPMNLMAHSAMKCTRNVAWKDSVLRWRIPRNHLLYVLSLKKELDELRYHPAPYCVFRVTEPKPRDIKAPLFRDRVVQTAALDGGLQDDLSKGFIYDNTACQKDKGMHLGIERLKCHMQRVWRRFGFSAWAAKLDLHDYYGSIVHDGLIEDTRKVVRNKDYIREAETVIRSFGPRGLGLGSPMSQQMALFRLSDFDHYVKEVLHCKYYERYNDDIVVIEPTKERLQEVVAKMKEKLAELGLQLNPKSCIFPLSQGIVFLKWRFTLTDTGRVVMRKRRKSVSRFVRYMRHQQSRMKAGELAEQDIRNSFESWKSHMEMGDSHKVINKVRRLLNV